MKLSKKIISVILSLTMIMSAISICFTTIAAPADVTEADWTALIDALKNDYVKDVAVVTNTNSTTAATVTIQDNANGDVLAALQAYVAIYDKVVTVDTGSGSSTKYNNAYRTTTQVGQYINTQVQNRAGADFTAYNMASRISAFRASADPRTSSGNTSQTPNGFTATVKVAGNPEDQILAAATVDEIDTASSSAVYAFKHSRVSYRSGWSTVYYLQTNAKSAASSEASTLDISALKALDAAVKANEAVIAMDLAAMLTMTATEIGAAYQALNPAYTAAKNGFSNAVIAHFFDAAAIEAAIKNLDDAGNIVAFIPVCGEINDLCATAIEGKTTSELVTLYETLAAKVEAYEEASAVVKAYLTANGYIDFTAVEAKFEAIETAKELAQLRDLKAAVDAAYDEFSAYTEDAVIAGTVTLDALTAASSVISAYVSNINSFDAANVETVFGAGYTDKLTALKDELVRLIGVENYDAAAATKYNSFINEVYAAINLESETADLIAQIDTMKTWSGEYATLLADAKAALGDDVAEKIFGGMNAVIEEKVAATYAGLYARTSAQVDVAYNLYTALKTQVGMEAASVTNLSTYAKLDAALKAIDVELYDYAKANGLDAAVVAKYDAINADGILDDYYSFVKTNGLDRFETSTIADIIRKITDKDVARDKDYVVTDEKTEAIIEILDKALMSTEIKGLGVDVGELIGQLPSMIYSDDVINALVGMLFPMVTDLLIPVWATLLPPTFDIPTDNPDIPDIVAGKSGTLDILPIGQVAANIHLNIFPTLLAGDVEADFPGVAAVLKQATTVPSYSAKKVSEGLAPGETADDNNVYVLDADGNHINEVVTNPWNDEVLYDEDGKLALEWGVTDKDSFVTALSDILRSLEGLLVGIVGGAKSGYFRGYTLGKGAILEIINIPIIAPHVKLNLNTLQLVVKIGDWENNKGVNLFNNVLAPIFEALGLEKDEIADGNTFATNEDMLYAIFNALEAVLDKLAASPVTFLTEALPNLAYAVDSGALMKLVESIDIPFVVKAGVPSTKEVPNSATLSGGLASALSGLIEALAGGALEEAIGLDMFIDNFPTSLKIAELVDLNNIEVNGSKLDLRSLNGLLGLVGGLLGVELPSMDSAKLATLGTVVEKDTRRDVKAYEWGTEGKAAYIQANKADVLLFVLDYVLKALQDPAFLEAIMGAFAEEPAEGEEAAPVEIPAIVSEIIANVANNSDDAIAAIAELVFPQEYTMPGGIEWADVETNGVEYSEFWTKDKAEFVAENLPTFVDNILSLFGVKMNDEPTATLSAVVESLIGSLYTADTANSLVAMINDLVGGIEIPEELTAIIADTAGLDLGYWADLSYDFADGDKDAFKAAVVEILNPLTTVLKFLLAEEDLVIRLTNDEGKFDVVTVKGYNGYADGIVPLLEALEADAAATDVMTTAAFLADKDNIVNNIVTMLLAIVDKIAADPYNQVFAVLPNVLYYLASDGFKTTVDNVLFPVNVVLDTIRPIYDVNLEALLSDLTGTDFSFATFDIVGFLFSTISATVLEKTGIALDVDFTSESLLEELPFDGREAFTSANGKEAYKITMSVESKADMITVLLRFVLSEFVYSENATKYAVLAKNQFDLSNEEFEFLYAILFTMRYLHEDHPDYTLGILFWVFYGADTAADAVVDFFATANKEVAAVLAKLAGIKTEATDKVTLVMTQVYKKVFGNDYTAEINKIANDVAKRINDFAVELDAELVAQLASIQKTLDGIYETVDATLKDFTDKVDETLGDITDKIEDGKDKAEDTLNGVADEINGVNDKMNSIFDKILKFFRDLVEKIKNIFKF